MGMIANEDFRNVPYTSQDEARALVLDGVKDVQNGRTRDFNEVCDRLEQKYRNAALQS